MSTFSSKSRYNLISIITFTVILLSFGYYYFYFVSNQEIRFREKAFRIIERVGENVEGKYNNYNTIIKNGLNHIINYKLDSFKNNTILEEDFITNEFKDLNIPTELKVVKSNFRVDIIKEIINHQDKLNPKISYRISNEKISIRYKVDDEYVVIEYKLDYLFKNTLRHDFFKKYIIFSDENIYYADIPFTKNDRVLTDTLFKRNAFKSSELAEIEFDNKLHDLYIVPVNIGTNETIYIGGIIDKEYFRKVTFRLNPIIVALIIFLLVLLILALPLLKLYLISENERLSTFDAVLSFVVLVLGTAFIFIVLVYNFSQKGPSNKNRADNLRNLSYSIQQNLTYEIKDILNQTDINNSILKRKIDSMPLGDNNCFPFDKTSRFNTSEYEYALNTTWINNNAEQLVKWRNKNITPRINVSSRKYFQNPKNKNLWQDDNISEDRFYIEFIRAMTDGANYAMVSKGIDSGYFNKNNSDINFSFSKRIDSSGLSPTVITMGSRFESLSNLQLPENYSYLLIDENGEVLHHKNRNKILQENLIAETNENKILNAAIHGRTDTTFYCNYESKACMFYIKPLGNLPLFLLVYSDHDYEKINDVQILNLSTSLYLLFFLIIFLQIGLFVIVDYKKRTKIKGYNLFLRWFWPNPKKDNIFTTLISYIILSILIYVFTGIYENILMTFSFFSLITTVNLILLRNPNNLKKLYREFKYVLFFIPFIGFGFLLFIYSFPFGSIQVTGFIIFVILSVISVIYSNWLQFAIIKTKIKDKYNLYIFLTIIAIGMFPVISYYPNSYNFERKLFLKNTQLSLAKKIINSKNQNVTKYNNHEEINSFIAKFSKIQKKENNYLVNTKVLNLFENLRIAINPRVDNSTILNKTTDDSSRPFHWEENSDSLMMIYVNNDKIVISSKKILLNKNSFRREGFQSSNYKFIFILAVLLLSIVLYGLVHYWSRKIFLKGLIGKSNINIPHVLQSYEYIYVVTPPYSGAVHFIKKTLKDCEEIDLKYADKNCYLKGQLDKIRNSKNETALIFDSDSDDINILKIKTKLISEIKDIVRKGNSIQKIVFVSFSHPSYKKKLVGDEKEEDINKIKSYVNIIADFVRVYYPLGYGQNNEKTNSESQTGNFLWEETKNVKIFRDKIIKDVLEKTEMTDKEDDILNVQHLTQNYYYSLWNSLEKREHYLIYDIAQDGLANYRNLPVIYNLINKGILIYKNGRLKFFNKSFQNFVLTIIDREQALLIEREAKQSGNWSNLQLPLIMVILSVIAFIFITQQNVFNEIVGWLTGALATIPVLTRIIAGVASVKLFKTVAK